MWDQRYNQPEYFFGRGPADLLRRESKHLRAGGRVLCIADGEGRNSVYLAGLGYDVTAFDSSPVGVEKARRLAEQNQVTPDFHLSGVETWDWTQTFDAVVAIFIQFAAPELRERMFRWMAQAIVPGGVLLLHGYERLVANCSEARSLLGLT